jgi:hypothetical protein
MLYISPTDRRVNPDSLDFVEDLYEQREALGTISSGERRKLGATLRTMRQQAGLATFPGTPAAQARVRGTVVRQLAVLIAALLKLEGRPLPEPNSPNQEAFVRNFLAYHFGIGADKQTALARKLKQQLGLI